MKIVRLLILGISDSQWNAIVEFTSGEGNLVFLPGKEGHAVVAIIVDEGYKQPVLGAMTINDRITGTPMVGGAKGTIYFP